MLLSGGSELVSLGAVLPFLAVLSDPQRLWQYTWIQELSSWAGWTNPGQLLVQATGAFAVAAVLTAVVRLANLWLNGRLAAAVGSDLSSEAYRRMLCQPYEVHLQRNSASVINTITSQIGRTVVALNNLLQLTTASIVALVLLFGLLLIDWKVAIGTAALLSCVYWVLSVTARRELSRNSQQIASASQQLVKALQEGLGAIRDVLLEGSQPFYLDLYRRADRVQRQRQAKNDFLATFPRYTLEALGMMAIALLGGLLVLQRGSSGAVIPLLGALALGAQRLLPALQQVYAGWAILKALNADMAGVLAMLELPLLLSSTATVPLHLTRSIQFRSVHFSYTQDTPKVLKGLDFEICRGDRIALIGSTGSGKSTTVDILMALLKGTSKYY